VTDVVLFFVFWAIFERTALVQGDSRGGLATGLGLGARHLS
jgi:hypothetical protein